MAKFEASVVIRSTPQAVFEFLSRPANMLKVNPPDLQVTVVNAPERVEKGSKIELKLQTHGFSQDVVHEVTSFNPPTGFAEKQVKGALQKWEHEHIIDDLGNGEVRLTDRIDFEPPGGLIGFMVTEARVKSSLETNFAHQHQAMKKLLESGNA